MGDLGEVLLVEQAHLQRAGVGGQRGDLRGAQRGQPAHPAELLQGGDAGGGDHAAVPDHHHVLQREGVFHRGDRGGERGRVGGVAGEHPDRDRAAGRGR